MLVISCPPGERAVATKLLGLVVASSKTLRQAVSAWASCDRSYLKTWQIFLWAGRWTSWCSLVQ